MSESTATPRPSKWIPVGERLPEVYATGKGRNARAYSDPVLVYREDGAMMIANYHAQHRKQPAAWVVQDFLSVFAKGPQPAVTHWRPLPRPPQK